MRAALVAVLLAAACGHGPPALELGTGKTDFEVVTDGQTLAIQTGTQGAYHLWGAVRAHGLAPTGCTLQCSLGFADGGQSISVSTYRVDLTPSGGWDQATGVVCFIAPTLVQSVRGQRVTMAMSATDSTGLTLTDSHTVVAQ